MSTATSTPPGWRRLFLLVPLALFAGLAAIFLMRLESGVDPEAIPSALIGHPAPDFDLPPLPGLKSADAQVPGLSTADLHGHVTLVNVFASWCGPCRDEHTQLEALAADKRIRMVGINYKDVPDNALRFLGEMGNPFSAVGIDRQGRTAVDWGVYGVPETFIVGPDGVIRFKYVGPIGPEALGKIIKPEIGKALAAPSG